MLQYRRVNVAAIVVTFNRYDYLKKNIDALQNQSIEMNEIYIINNGWDEMTEFYIKSLILKDKKIKYIKTKCNVGGAGGFYEGLKLAILSNNEWFWLMDDDCIPDRDCLENMLLHVKDKRYAYEPLVYDENDKTRIMYDKNRKPNSGIHEVKIHVFNGFLVSKEIVKEIGLPEKDFFIYWDDIEYCLRINAAGGKVFLNTHAKMFHPDRVRKRTFVFFIIKDYDFNKLHVYYATRNMIILNNRYGGYKLEISEIVRRLILYCVTLRYDLLKLFIKAIAHGRKNRFIHVVPNQSTHTYKNLPT